MRNAITLALVLASTPVAAQPVTGPVTRPCAVTIARAPDDVRIVVDAWIAAEPSCSTALEVRIVPTEGGLYLLARDEHGRVRERIVPDAQSAGVLIASWAADDVIVAQPTPAPPPEPVIAPTPTPDVPPAVAPPAPTPIAGPSMMGPSMAPGAAAVAGPVDGPPAPPPPKRISKWITAGGLVGDGDDGGARLEIDILTRGKWSFGLAGSATNAHTYVFGGSYGGDLTTADKKLTATVTRNIQYGRFQLRGSAGLGIVYSEADVLMQDGFGAYSDFLQGDDVFSVIDASLLVGVELGKSWAITGGPVFTLYDQVFETQSTQMTWEPQLMTVKRQTVEVMGYLGLRYRL